MSEIIRVQKLRLADLDRILQIEHESFGKDAYERNLFAEFYRKCGGLFLTAVWRSLLCGYMVTCVRGDRAEVISIAVAPSARGNGAASALMESTIRRLRRRKVTRMVLMVKVTNHAARLFYEKYYFRKLRLVRRYYEDGSDGVLMVREI